ERVPARGHQGIAGERPLKRAQGRKVRRARPAGDVRVPQDVDRDSETDVRAGAAEICSVEKDGAGGIQFHDERVESTAAEHGLERRRTGRKVGGGREARDVHVAGRVDGDPSTRVIAVRSAKVGRIRSRGEGAVELYD